MREAPDQELRRGAREAKVYWHPAKLSAGVKVLLILVRDNNLDQALRVLKKKLHCDYILAIDNW